jgi:hypothetical protein
MSRAYDPAAWYWIVARDATRVFSSGAGAYVAADDPGYRAWLAGGGEPTRIAGETDLLDVLARQAPDRARAARAALTQAVGRYVLARELVENVLGADDILAIQAAAAVRPPTAQSRALARLWAMLLSRGDQPINLDGATAGQGIALLGAVLGRDRADQIVQGLRAMARP